MFRSICLVSAILFAGVALAASNSPLTLSQAKSAVISAAHKHIASAAPDFGGSVNSPCDTLPQGDKLTVTCTGVANETIGGGGSVKVDFTCNGEFSQGQDGNFYKISIQCVDNR